MPSSLQVSDSSKSANASPDTSEADPDTITEIPTASEFTDTISPLKNTTFIVVSVRNETQWDLIPESDPLVTNGAFVGHQKPRLVSPFSQETFLMAGQQKYHGAVHYYIDVDGTPETRVNFVIGWDVSGDQFKSGAIEGSVLHRVIPHTSVDGTSLTSVGNTFTGKTKDGKDVKFGFKYKVDTQDPNSPVLTVIQYVEVV